jgi:hypothetical protein
LTIKLTPHVAIALRAGLHRSARHRECGQVRLSTPLALPRAELAVFAPRDLSSRNAMPSSFSCQRTPPCTSLPCRAPHSRWGAKPVWSRLRK